MSNKLNKVRAEIATAKADIATVGNAALDAAGVARQVDAWLAAQSRLVEEHFTGLASFLAYDRHAESGDVWPLFTEALKFRPEVAVALQAHFQRDTFRAHLIGAAEAGVADVPRVADRGQETERLNAYLLELERAEEAEIERLEAAGETVYRRADMDPRAILGLPA